jgi:predicted MFS family arabinose efflux permease
VRGEAMGWHGSFLTTGGAMGAPLAGLAIDAWGSPAAFVTVATVGLVVAMAGVATTRVRRSARQRAQLSDAARAPVQDATD